MATFKSLFVTHRLILMAIFAALIVWAGVSLNWGWLPKYTPLILKGIWTTAWLLVLTSLVGFLLAIPLGLAQVIGPWYLSAPARAFCTIMRGTPFLLQIWLLYYGLGSLFPQYPWIRSSELWPILRQAWPYAVLALSLSFAAYEGEVMRGAFKGVAKGQLEAAKAFGMTRTTMVRRIWLPLAVRNVLPTLGGEAILHLKTTPLVATIAIIDIYAAASRIRQDTFIVYEPLLLLAVIYLLFAGSISVFFHWLERQVPRR